MKHHTPINWVKILPAELCNNSIYFLKVGNGIKMYVTDSQGVAYLIGANSIGNPVIISPDESILVEQLGQVFELSIVETIQNLINTALQQGDNISLLTNDAGYITSAEVIGIQSVTDDGNIVVEVDNADPQNPIIKFNGVITDGTTIGGSGTEADPLEFIGTSGGIQTIVAGENVTVDNTDPLNPVVSATPDLQAVATLGSSFTGNIQTPYAVNPEDLTPLAQVGELLSNAGNRTVKLVTDEDPYFLIQSDKDKFLTITTEFDPVLSLGFTANTEFWIKNTSPTPREVLFDTDIEFIGSPLIPTNGLAILKLIEVVGGVEYWSVNHLLANGTPSGGGFKKNIFFTTTLADLGLSTFDELTNEIVADWIDSLEIVENDNEIYYFEVTDELSYNFDVTADWEGNEITNQSVFENYISATVSDFSLVEGRLRCNIQTSNEYIYLNNLGVTNINIFSYEGILELDLSDNNLLVFNPSKPLPDTLTKLFIDNNQIVDFNPALQLPMLTELSLEGNLIVQFGFNNLPLTLLKLNLSGNLIEVFNLNLSGLTSLERVFLDGNNLSFLSPENVLPPSVWQFTIASNQIDSAGWVASESWASAQPLFDPGCGLETNLNIDTAFGTGFETILFTKNANITD